jgi:DNA-binding XRE family transcriptional regulator
MDANEFPRDVKKELEVLGANLRLARQRRAETQENFAQRIGVSRQTLADMENGMGTVSIGSYAKVLWLLGMTKDIGDLANPDKDKYGKAAQRERMPVRERSKKRDMERINF